MDLNHILQKILEAHGGLDLWNNLEAIERPLKLRSRHVASYSLLSEGPHLTM